jgi:hypothetical protein
MRMRGVDTELVKRAQHGDREAFGLVAADLATRFLAVSPLADHLGATRLPCQVGRGSRPTEGESAPRSDLNRSLGRLKPRSAAAGRSSAATALVSGQGGVLGLISRSKAGTRTAGGRRPGIPR